jgi:hypothetical protein
MSEGFPPPPVPKVPPTPEQLDEARDIFRRTIDGSSRKTIPISDEKGQGADILSGIVGKVPSSRREAGDKRAQEGLITGKIESAESKVVPEVKIIAELETVPEAKPIVEVDHVLETESVNVSKAASAETEILSHPNHRDFIQEKKWRDRLETIKKLHKNSGISWDADTEKLESLLYTYNDVKSKSERDATEKEMDEIYEKKGLKDDYIASDQPTVVSSTIPDSELPEYEAKPKFGANIKRSASDTIFSTLGERPAANEHTWKDRLDTLNSAADFSGIHMDSDIKTLERLHTDYEGVVSSETRDLIETRMNELYAHILNASEVANAHHANEEYKSKIPLVDPSYKSVDSLFVKRRDERNARIKRLADMGKGVSVLAPEVIALDLKLPTEALTDLTKPELRAKLKDTVGQLSQLAERTGRASSPEKIDMDAKENAYLEAYKNMHSKNALMRGVNTIKAAFGKSSETTELAQLKRYYDQSRLEYAKLIDQKARDASTEQATREISVAFRNRTKEKFNNQIIASGTDEEKLAMFQESSEHNDKFEAFLQSENENRRIKTIESIGKMARFHHVIKPAALKKLDAREQALGEKGQSTLNKIALGLKDWNSKKEAEYGKIGWKARKILFFTAIATLGAAATGVGLTTALFGFAGLKIIRSVTGMVTGSATGGLSGIMMGKQATRTQNAAIESLRAHSGKFDAFESIEDFDTFDNEQAKNISNAKDSTVQKKTAIAAALGGFIAGAGATSLFHMVEILTALPSMDALTDTSTDHANLPASHPGINNPATHSLAKAPAENIKVANTSTSTPVSSGTTLPEQSPVISSEHTSATLKPETHNNFSVKVEHKINNADKLLGEFRKELEAKYPDGKGAPPDVQKFLGIRADTTAQTEDLLSKTFNLQNAQSMSGTINPGDTLALEADKIVFHSSHFGNESHALFDVEGKPNTFDIDKMHATDHIHKELLDNKISKSDTTESNEPATTAAENNAIPVWEKTLLDQQKIDIAKTADFSDTTHFSDNSLANASEVQKVNTVDFIPSESNHESLIEKHTTLGDGHDNTSELIRGINFSKPIVLSDNHNNLFAHIPRTEDVTVNSDQAYKTAIEYSLKNPKVPVYWVNETKGLLGNLKQEVYAVMYDPTVAQSPQDYSVHNGEAIVMPEIPKDTDLKLPS